MRPGKKLKGKSYTSDELREAVEEVKAKRLTSWQAGKKYGIPHSTIYGLAKGWRNRPPPLIVGRSMGRPTVISQGSEEEIANCLAALIQWGFRFNRKYLLDFVQVYVKKMNLKTPFPEGRPGWKWFRSFMERKNMTEAVVHNFEETPPSLEPDPRVIYGFFDLLSGRYTDEDVWSKPECIYSLCETLVVFDPATRTTVVAPADRKETSKPEKETTTVLTCASASGDILPPHVLFEGHTLKDSWNVFPEMYPGTSVDCSYNGQMSQNTFTRWFQKVFIKKVKARPCVLIMDGPVSHMSMELTVIAITQKVIIINLPPHTTTILQPLHLAFFKPFNEEMDAVASKWQHECNLKTTPKPNLLQEISKFWHTLSSKTCKEEFEKKGIFPYNPSAIPIDIFKTCDFRRYVEIQKARGKTLFIKPEIPDDNIPETSVQTKINIKVEEIEPVVHDEVGNADDFVTLRSFFEDSVEVEGDDDIEMPSADGFVLPNDLTDPHKMFTTIVNDLHIGMSAERCETSSSSDTFDGVESLDTPQFSEANTRLSDKSVQTTLTLDPNITDKDLQLLQQMRLYFQRKNSHVCTYAQDSDHSSQHQDPST